MAVDLDAIETDMAAPKPRGDEVYLDALASITNGEKGKASETVARWDDAQRRLPAYVPALVAEVWQLRAENERLLAANAALREGRLDGDAESAAAEWRTAAEQLAAERDGLLRRLAGGEQ